MIEKIKRMSPSSAFIAFIVFCAIALLFTGNDDPSVGSGKKTNHALNVEHKLSVFASKNLKLPKWMNSISCSKPDEKKVSGCEIQVDKKIWKETIEVHIQENGRYPNFPDEFHLVSKSDVKLNTEFDGSSLNFQHASAALQRSVLLAIDQTKGWKNEEFQAAFLIYKNLESYSD